MALRDLLNTIPNFPNLPLWDQQPTLTAEWIEDQNRQIRHATRAAIIDLFDRIYHSPCPYIRQDAPGHLNIRCERLFLRDPGWHEQRQQFFRPKTLAWLEGHPVDIHNISTQRRIASTEAQWSAPETGYCGDYSEAAVVAAGFVHEFSKYERVAVHGDYTLEDLSGWVDRGPGNRIESRKSMRPTYTDMENRPATAWTTKIAASWIRDDARPHLSCVLENASPPQDDLLRSEVLTILGLMRESLSRHSLQDHKVIPVSAISCMNGLEARVIQAHFMKGELVIYKSRLLEFSELRSRAANVPLFLTYLAAEPVGDTVQRPPRPNWLLTQGSAFASYLTDY
ncbi:hypothetical protein BJX70DRAFT_396082 [Aspergillus crustosus]